MSAQLLDICLLSDRYAPRKRVGRGIGSGLGKTAGRGSKGAGSRAGWQSRPAFEGGQKQLFRRVAKRGFNNNAFAKGQLSVVLHMALRACGSTISDAVLREKFGKPVGTPVVLYGSCELPGGCVIEGCRCSKGVVDSIAKVGGVIR